MILRSSLLLLILLLPATPLPAQVTDNLYEQIAEYGFRNALSLESGEDYLYVLLGNSVAVVNTESPGLKLPVDASVSFAVDYRHLYRMGNWLYCYRDDGRLAISRIYGDRLTIYAEADMGDSVKSLVSAGRYLYLASGFAGIRIIDAGERRHPQQVSAADHGVYYSALVLHDQFLFAVDDYNGIDIFEIEGDSLRFHATLPTERSATGLVFLGNRLFVCYGDNAVNEYQFDDFPTVVLEREHTFEHQVQGVAAAGPNLLLSFRQGLLGLYAPANETMIDSLQLSYSVAEVRMIASDPAQAVISVVNTVGGVELISATDSLLSVVKSIELDSRPHDIVAVGDYLLAASGGGGIDRFELRGGNLRRFPAYPAAKLFTSLVEEDMLLFAASDGDQSLSVYDLQSGKIGPIAEISLYLPSVTVDVDATTDSEYVITSIAASGAESFRWSRQTGLATPLWQLSLSQPIKSGFRDGDLLGVITRVDTLLLYRIPDPATEPELVSRHELPTAVRNAWRYTDYLLIGSEGSTPVARLVEPYTQLDFVEELTTVIDAYDFAYDPQTGAMLAACGDDGIKYFPFDDPEAISSVYPVVGSSGSARLVVSSMGVYALSGARLLAYEAAGLDEPDVTPPNRFQVTENYPNPFNQSTRIDVWARGGEVLGDKLDFEVYNILGQLVYRQQFNPGSERITLAWDGVDQNGGKVASGLYLLRLRAPGIEVVRKALLLK